MKFEINPDNVSKEINREGKLITIVRLSYTEIYNAFTKGLSKEAKATLNVKEFKEYIRKQIIATVTPDLVIEYNDNSQNKK